MSFPYNQRALCGLASVWVRENRIYIGTPYPTIDFVWKFLFEPFFRRKTGAEPHRHRTSRLAAVSHVRPEHNPSAPITHKKRWTASEFTSSLVFETHTVWHIRYSRTNSPSRFLYLADPPFAPPPLPNNPSPSAFTSLPHLILRPPPEFPTGVAYSHQSPLH